MRSLAIGRQILRPCGATLVVSCSEHFERGLSTAEGDCWGDLLQHQRPIDDSTGEWLRCYAAVSEPAAP
jgi:hypothetical protein